MHVCLDVAGNAMPFPRIRKESPPLGEVLICPVGDSGAVATKNIGCLPIQDASSESMVACWLLMFVNMAHFHFRDCVHVSFRVRMSGMGLKFATTTSQREEAPSGEWQRPGGWLLKPSEGIAGSWYWVPGRCAEQAFLTCSAASEVDIEQ